MKQKQPKCPRCGEVLELITCREYDNEYKCKCGSITTIPDNTSN